MSSSSSSSSSSCSSSSEGKWRFDVFINFRGEDVRSGFVADLYSCLSHGRINAYIDSEDLRRGDEISRALMKAIEESRIAVLVFSENYASSRWCLDELVKVMECRRLKEQRVLPVFYKVEPGVIRGQRESYRKALASHEKELGQDSERVKKWRQALTEAGNLSGWHFDDGDDTKFIEGIVKDISTIIRRAPLNVAKYPVGLGSRVKYVKALLSMSSDDVRMIGIWGNGGIGKTTIAKAVYNSIADQFDECGFLANVRETSSRPNGLVDLQNKLLSQILWKRNLVVSSVDEGANLIPGTLCFRKILLVLDDVDHGDQLNALARECGWFGKGSRIIITTRDKHVLTSHGINQVYKVEPLDEVEAFELLSSHAFPRNQTKDIHRDLIYNILGYVNGLPLAIVVLGPLLCGRSREAWESILKNLAESPLTDINCVLKISFDALDNNQKDIFLDIACFFKGEERDYVTRVLDSCDLHTLIGIQTLIERSLVTIENERIVQMHDLIQLMGQDIVKQECPNYPGRQSRLWCYDDVYEVLSAATGTNDVKGIVLQLQRPAKLHISPSAFMHMRRLKLLILSNARISGGPVCLPDDLRWLEWHRCHSSTLKFSAGPKKLVCFDVRGSQIKKFGGNLKDFSKLKFITLVQCQSLICMPDISCTPNLEELCVVNCKNLKRVHESIACHGKLWSLSLSGCSNLQSFPDISVKNEALLEVYLTNTGIKELPASIGNFVSLKRMDLMDSKKLAILPSSIYKLQNLENLQLGGCSRLTKFPKEEEEDLSECRSKKGFPMLSLLNLECCHLPEAEFLDSLSSFPRLQILNLEGNNFTDLPTCEKLYNLKGLDVSDCQQLQEIPKLPKKLRRLWANNCKSLSRLPSKICDVERVELYLSRELVRNGAMNDYFKFEKFHCQRKCQVILPGGEMPKWLLPIKEGYISFMASKDLYKRILGVTFCAVFRVEVGSYGPAMLFRFELIVFVNCKGTIHSRYIKPFDLDNVWLEYMESKDLWTVDHLGPNDPSHFHISIRINSIGGNKNQLFVKKCGFRLICKPLGNDSEVLLRDNSLLDPALLYEVSHEDNLMSTNEERSSETEDLHYKTVDSEVLLQDDQLPDPVSLYKVSHEDNPMSTNEERSSEIEDLHYKTVDFPIERHRYSSRWFDFQNVSPGREMPKGFILVEDGTISFKASQDLYNKFKGLYLCVVFDVEDGKKEVSFDIVPHVNGQRRNELSGTLGSFDTNHVWFQLFMPNALWGYLEGAVDFCQFDERYLSFSLDIRVAGATVKKLGYVMQSDPLEDALKVELEKNRLMNPASLLQQEGNLLYYKSHGWKALCEILEYMHGGRDSTY